MMNYVLLAYRDEQRWASMSSSEQADFEEACHASQQNLIHGLHLIEFMSTQNNTALTVRIVNGQLSLTDDPLSGSQEQLIQFLFIRARDLNAAIQIAAMLPQARAGPIEVRQIVELER